MRSLDSLQPGEAGIVQMVSGKGAIRRKLVDMGVTRGTVVRVRRVAPLGDPLEVLVRGYSLTVRRADARNIFLEGEPFNA